MPSTRMGRIASAVRHKPGLMWRHLKRRASWFASTLWLKSMVIRARVQRMAGKLASLALTWIAVLGLGVAWRQGWVTGGGAPAEFLIGVGATIATVLTLAISLSTISIQRAAEDFSPGLVRAYRSDRTLAGVFFAISFIALGNFGLAMFADRIPPATILVVGLLSFAVALDALRWIYARVGRALEPVEAMQYMAKMAGREARRYARVARLVQRSMTPARAVSASDAPIAAVAFAAVPGYAGTLRTWSDYFTEDAIRAVGRNQTRVAMVATRCIGALIMLALRHRRHDVVFRTSRQYLLLRQADIDSVLQYMYDRLSRIGTRGLSAREDQLTVDVIKTLCESASAAATIRDPLQPGSAPLAFAPFKMAMDLVHAGMAGNDLEVVFQGANVVSTFAMGMTGDLGTREFARPATELVGACALYLRLRGQGGLAESMLAGIARVVTQVVLDGSADQVEDVEELLRPALALQVQPALGANGFFGDFEWIDHIAGQLHRRATIDGNSARDRAKAATTLCEFCEQLARHLRELYRQSPQVDAIRATEARITADRLLATLVRLERLPEIRDSPNLVESVEEAIETLLSVFTWVLHNQRDPHPANLDDVASLLRNVVYGRRGSANWNPTVSAARTAIGLARTCVDHGWPRQAADLLVSVWQVERVVEAHGSPALATTIAQQRRELVAESQALREDIEERFNEETKRLQRCLDGQEWIGRHDREEAEFVRAVRQGRIPA